MILDMRKSVIYIMKNVLESLQNYEDIKKLDYGELMQLCSDIRSFLIENISKTGGHLASNLGVVELTVALHRVFDFPDDKIVFDVGHQCYVHKCLTGRKDGFNSLRRFGGMSGFPKRSESEFDAFDTGHSSTSVSAALGMARARDLAGENNNIIALFGDGALTGGEIYEAINDAGHSKTPLILVLNDNNMSISKNSSAVSRHLRNIRINRVYFKSKERVSNFLNKIPLVGMPIRRLIESVKKLLRQTLLQMTIFEELGFKYIGPIDGHNLQSLIDCFEYAKTEKKPIILHVKTTKGKGYTPAERNPSLFHGVGSYEPQTGNVKQSDENCSMHFGKTLCEIARDNERVVAITCAMPDGTGLDEFSREFRSRFFDVGIAEQHGVTFAAGMAASGFIPVIPIYSTFLQRAYDQILHDVCLQNLHVVFPVDRAGIVGADGETHQGVFDISFLSQMPNMTLLSPSSFMQLDSMLRYAIYEHDGPIAIRYPRGKLVSPYPEDEFKPGMVLTHKTGSDITIISTGRMMQTAKNVEDILEKSGISVGVTELTTISPINEKAIINAAGSARAVITIEDNVKSGGMGERIAEIILSNGISCYFKIFAFPCKPIVHGSVDELDKKYGMDAQTIAKTAAEGVNGYSNGKNKT